MCAPRVNVTRVAREDRAIRASTMRHAVRDEHLGGDAFLFYGIFDKIALDLHLFLLCNSPPPLSLSLSLSVSVCRYLSWQPRNVMLIDLIT